MNIALIPVVMSLAFFFLCRDLRWSPSTADGPPHAISSTCIIITVTVAQGGFVLKARGPISMSGHRWGIHVISGLT
jgi:hypothetical protein